MVENGEEDEVLERMMECFLVLRECVCLVSCEMNEGSGVVRVSKVKVMIKIHSLIMSPSPLLSLDLSLPLLLDFISFP